MPHQQQQHQQQQQQEKQKQQPKRQQQQQQQGTPQQQQQQGTPQQQQQLLRDQRETSASRQRPRSNSTNKNNQNDNNNNNSTTTISSSSIAIPGNNYNNNHQKQQQRERDNLKTNHNNNNTSTNNMTGNINNPKRTVSNGSIATSKSNKSGSNNSKKVPTAKTATATNNSSTGTGLGAGDESVVSAPAASMMNYGNMSLNSYNPYNNNNKSSTIIEHHQEGAPLPPIGGEDAASGDSTHQSVFFRPVYNLHDYPGSTLEDKLESLVRNASSSSGNNVMREGNGDLEDIEGKTTASVNNNNNNHAYHVVVIGKSYCPLANEAVELLTEQLCVNTLVLFVDHYLDSTTRDSIMEWTKLQAHRPTPTPAIFIRGQYCGSAEDLFSLYHSNKLERRLLRGIIRRRRTRDASHWDTARLEPVYRAAVPPAWTRCWFPVVVNLQVARIASLFVLFASLICACFYQQSWIRYLVTSIFINFSLRAIGGYTLSPYGMASTLIAHCFYRKRGPHFGPGAPWQAATFVGMFLSFIALVFNLIGFPGSDIGVLVIMLILALGATLPGIFNVSWGPYLIEYGIRLKLVPENVYRLYLHTRFEAIQTWNYKFGVVPQRNGVGATTNNHHHNNNGGGNGNNNNGKPPKPVIIYTNRDNPIALKYKKKTDEWRKDDFDPIRHIQPEYFAMPMSIGGLAVAFKFAADLDARFSEQYEDIGRTDLRPYHIPDEWFQVFASLSAFLYVFMLFLYLTKALLWPDKARKEWNDLHRSSCFSCITMCFLFFGFLCYDQDSVDVKATATTSTATSSVVGGLAKTTIGGRSASEFIGRALFWVGSVAQAILTVAKMGEWIGRRMELEHVNASWMLVPMGLGVSSFVGGLVHPFSESNPHSLANLIIIRFYLSFAMLLWITLFIVTFFKVVTNHNSDPRSRHGIWNWMSVPCILGIADFTLCQNHGQENDIQECHHNFTLLFFIGIFFLFSLIWSSLPGFFYFERDSFHMGFWFECFALDCLAMSSALFYYANPWPFNRVLEMATLSIATTANLVAFLHTLFALVKRRDVCTPDIKWGPLSFMKLTHCAMRQSLATVRYHLESIDLDDPTAESVEQLGLFVAHFNRFRIVFEEHTKQKDDILYRAFADFFPRHPRKYKEEHQSDTEKMKKWCDCVSKLVSVKLPLNVRQDNLTLLQAELPSFFVYYRQHTRGEDENLFPIADKYFSTELSKQLACEIWSFTPAEKWETLLPFCLLNLPRHAQRIQYLRAFCWAMPERAQQIGAIVFRNVDDVMWERLRVEIPEMIPRGAPNWKRYY